MREASTFVGLDVHKNTISVALLGPGRSAPLEWSLTNETVAICRLIRKLEREGEGALQCCYEAGPTGYVLQRQLTRAGIDCRVVAPSLIPDHLFLPNFGEHLNCWRFVWKRNNGQLQSSTQLARRALGITGELNAL